MAPEEPDARAGQPARDPDLARAVEPERKHWPPDYEPTQMINFLGRPRLQRREKIRREIERGRHSRVPTWLLVVALIVVIAGWAALLLIP